MYINIGFEITALIIIILSQYLYYHINVEIYKTLNKNVSVIKRLKYIKVKTLFKYSIPIIVLYTFICFKPINEIYTLIILIGIGFCIRCIHVITRENMMSNMCELVIYTTFKYRIFYPIIIILYVVNLGIVFAEIIYILIQLFINF